MDNYNYPMGADTSDAPWNQSDPKPVNVEVQVTIVLTKTIEDLQKAIFYLNDEIELIKKTKKMDRGIQ